MNTKGAIHITILVVVVLAIGVVSFAGYRIYQSRNIKETDQSNIEQVEKKPVLDGETFSFNAAGDFSSSDSASQVLTSIGDSGSDFTLGLGDLGYGGNGTETDWCNFVKQRVGNDHPFEIVAGNHDDGTKYGDIKEYRKCLPNKFQALEGDYGIEYYFDYNDLVRVIMISPDIINYGYDYVNGSPHYSWLASTIDSARDKGLKWVILGMHKNCITPGVKTCEIGEDLLNLAVERGVDLILQGHEHSYFRSKQLQHNSNCEKVITDEFNPACVNAEGRVFSNNGSLISIVGTGGQVLRDMDFDDPEIEYFDTWNAKNSGNSYGYSSFEVSNENIKVSFISVGRGDFSDSYQINFVEN